MNTPRDELNIQRCIDGELPEASQHELFAELERTPGGWRELALAFVERQVFTKACGEMMTPPAPRAAALPAPRRGGGSTMSFRWTAVAGLLVALGVGFSAGRVTDRRPSEGIELLAQGPQPDPEASVPDSQPAPSPGSRMTPRLVPGRGPVFNVASHTQGGRPILLDLPIGQDGEQVESLQIPVYQPSSLPAGETEPSLLTAEEEDSLRDSGYRLDGRTRLISIPVEGGRSVVLPVKSYGARYEVR